MKTYCVVVAGAVLLILISSFKFIVAVDDEVLYPTGYRGWTHIKSTILGPQHPNVNYRGFNHVYANDLAMKGYASGKFPEGSVLVLEVVEAVPAENYTSEAGRHHMDVIQKDSLMFASTGGWGYAQFERDNSRRMLTLEQKKTCNTCHLKQEDHVFSSLRKVQ
jgi:hypothetical protein